MADRRPEPSPLLEREVELAAIDALLDAVQSSRGRVLVVQGDPGIGKTALAQAARRHAEGRGLAVHSARGTEFEQDYAYGGVRQLFDAWLASASAAERLVAFDGPAGLAAQVFGLEAGSAENDPADPGFATLHGLYWLAANLATNEPRLLVIDDAHWLDAPSLRWLVFLAGRIGQLPLGVVFTTRPVQAAGAPPFLEAISHEDSVEVVGPSALRVAAVRELAEEIFGDTVDDAFARACWTASGGNPLYVRELLRALQAEAVVPGPKGARLATQIAPQAVTRSVLGRLRSLPEGCERLAQLVAVAGGSLDVSTLAILMGIDGAAVLELADALAGQAIFARAPTMAFTHPMVGAAVYEDMPSALREREHFHMARQLALLGGKPERVAAQLLAIRPAGDRWAADLLRAAGSTALREGAPDIAVRYLRRAAGEFQAGAWPDGLACELGRAEAQLADPAGAEHLLVALNEATDACERGRIALDAADALRTSDRIEEAVRVLEEAIEEVHGLDSQLEMRLEAALYFAACASVRGAPRVMGRPRRLRARLTGATPAERSMRTMVALDVLFSGSGDADEIAALGEQSLVGLEFTSDEERMNAAITGRLLAWTDRHNAAAALLTTTAATAREAGSPAVFVYAMTSRAIANLRAGNVPEAVADGRNAIDTMETYGFPFRAALTFATPAEALIEYGDIPGAGELIERYFDSTYNLDDATHASMLHSRALLALSRADVPRAIDDLRACGDQMARWGVDNPTFVPWRSTLADALLASGQRADALTLAQKEVGLARPFGAPRVLGIALRRLARTEGGAEGIATLQEACDVLAGSESSLEYARALLDLGAARRRANQRVRARDALRLALDLADRCGARALVAEVRQELAAAGGRPRRTRLTGRDALTPSELRVAELAASGRSNREIAQGLFVTLRTIEMHLTRTYRKLDIQRREELADALSRTRTDRVPA